MPESLLPIESMLEEVEMCSKRMRDLKKALAETEGQHELFLAVAKARLARMLTEASEENLDACKQMLHELIWKKNIDVKFLQEMQVLIERSTTRSYSY
jgi:hypothetical protein